MNTEPQLPSPDGGADSDAAFLSFDDVRRLNPKVTGAVADFLAGEQVDLDAPLTSNPPACVLADGQLWRLVPAGEVLKENDLLAFTNCSFREALRRDEHPLYPLGTRNDSNEICAAYRR